MNTTQTEPPSPAASQPRKRSIFRWLIPLALVLFALPVLAIGGCVYWGLGALNAPVNAAVEALNNDPGVSAKLGSPIQAGSSKSISNYNNNNGNGGATVAFNASGPNGSASVDGKMKLTAGTWAPDGLTVTFGDGTEVTLKNQ